MMSAPIICFMPTPSGSAGTDVTFFEWATIAPQQPGTGAIDLMALRVNDGAAIAYWHARFAAMGAGS
jgi:hypothetical protein